VGATVPTAGRSAASAEMDMPRVVAAKRGR